MGLIAFVSFMTAGVAAIFTPSAILMLLDPILLKLGVHPNNLAVPIASVSPLFPLFFFFTSSSLLLLNIVLSLVYHYFLYSISLVRISSN